MNEEEKKAIESLRKNRGVSFAQADIISKLIDNQQKELEELKKENIELSNQITDGYWENDRLKNEIEKLQQKTINYDKTLERLQKDTISKDKIRSLLNQVNASLYHFKDSDKNNIMQRVKDRLEEILEE